MYHRVAEIESDPWALSVSPERFAQHLDVLRRYGLCLTLQNLVRAVEDLNGPRRAVALTFDDGYADNLHHAKPLLERYDVPATVFLSTGFLSKPREFWWDELERVLLQPGTLPPALTLVIAGCAHHWDLGEAEHYTDVAFRQHRTWKAWQQPPTERQGLFRDLWGLLQPLPAVERRRVLDELASWAGLVPSARPTHRALAAEEAACLGEGGLIDIGAHTMTHPVLPTLPAASQRDEICRSKDACEAIAGRSVSSFSYPYGRSASATAALVREAGFALACSTAPRVVRRGTDCFNLPRVHVLNWDGDAFAKRLARRFEP